MSRYWTEDELHWLRAAFLRHTGIDWDYAVEKAAHEGTVEHLFVDAKKWSLVSADVGTRTPKQCANRLQTERMWSTRSTADAHPAPMSTPVQLPLAATPWGVDVSPYIGAPTGRIVWRDGASL